MGLYGFVSIHIVCCFFFQAQLIFIKKSQGNACIVSFSILEFQHFSFEPALMFFFGCVQILPVCSTIWGIHTPSYACECVFRDDKNKIRQYHSVFFFFLTFSSMQSMMSHNAPIHIICFYFRCTKNKNVLICLS